MNKKRAPELCVFTIAIVLFVFVFALTALSIIGSILFPVGVIFSPWQLFHFGLGTSIFVLSLLGFLKRSKEKLLGFNIALVCLAGVIVAFWISNILHLIGFYLHIRDTFVSLISFIDFIDLLGLAIFIPLSTALIVLHSLLISFKQKEISSKNPPIAPVGLVAIRGATTADSNTQEDIFNASAQLFEQIKAANNLIEGSIVLVQISSSKDITAAYPATVLRHRGIGAPLFSSVEPDIDNALALCIRMLVFAHSATQNHVYIKGASDLLKT